jgi:hypothetical protein
MFQLPRARRTLCACLLAASLFLVAMTACGGVSGSGSSAPTPSDSASTSATPSASEPVSSIPTSGDVCAAKAPVPGCTELGDPYGAPSTCHVTVGRQLVIPRSPADNLPSYGYGAGPVYLSGQLTWYVTGEEAVFLINGTDTAAVTITGHLVGDGGTQPIFTGTDANGAVIDVPAGNDSPYWRFWDGQMSFTKAGCYTLGFQSQGANETVTIYVHPGGPPGG